MDANNNGYDTLRREYAEIAERYETRWKFYVEASIRETLSRICVSAEDRVLDVGCGTGMLLKALSLRMPQAHLAGVDLSFGMLKVARLKLGANVRLEQAYAETLPFADDTFDLTVSTNVMHFVRKPVEALREMKRVLKPSGIVLVTDWCDDYFICRVCDIFLRLFSRGHFRTYGSEDCRRLLLDADFANVDVERYKINWLWGLMTATGKKSPATYKRNKR